MCARIAAAATTGIGLTLLPSFYAYGGFGGAPPGEAQRRFLNAPDRFLRLLEGARTAVSGLPDAAVGIVPHSLRAVTPDTLQAVVDASPEGPIHIHAAEQLRESARPQRPQKAQGGIEPRPRCFRSSPLRHAKAAPSCVRQIGGRACRRFLGT